MVDFPVIFTPSSPVEFEGNSYRRLTFARPMGWAEIVAAEPHADTMPKMNAVTASLAGVHVGVIEALSVDDQLRLAETVVGPILELPPLTSGA